MLSSALGTAAGGRLQAVVAPSILSADFGQLAASCTAALDAGADSLHIDVMDGHHVPNITIGPVVVTSLRRALPGTFFDCHLMVSDPDKWLDAFAKAGANQISFHGETSPSPSDTIKAIHSHGMKASMAVSPDVDVATVLPYCAALDQVLIMTVHPGFGGQKFMASCLDKVRLVRREHPHMNIQVDGGLDLATVGAAAAAGANVIVAGTAVFGAKEVDGGMRGVIRGLREAVTIAQRTQNQT